jgi:hypothetical protein
MNKYRLLPSLLLMVFIAGSCKKDKLPFPPPVQCDEFQQGLINNDINKVKEHITSFINDLPSRQYTAENMEKLVNSINNQCTVSARVLCYDCIKTLPSMTEIILTVPSSSVDKAIDISYTAGNEMRFVNVH